MISPSDESDDKSWLRVPLTDPVAVAERYDEWAPTYDEELHAWGYEAPVRAARLLVAQLRSQRGAQRRGHGHAGPVGDVVEREADGGDPSDCGPSDGGGVGDGGHLGCGDGGVIDGVGGGGDLGCGDGGHLSGGVDGGVDGGVMNGVGGVDAGTGDVGYVGHLGCGDGGVIDGVGGVGDGGDLGDGGGGDLGDGGGGDLGCGDGGVMDGVGGVEVRGLAGVDGGAINDAVLDIGCGTGLTGLALRALGVGVIDGVDLSEVSLAAAQSRGIYRSLQRHNFNESSLPFADNSYRAAECVGVLSYAHDPRVLIVDACRVVQPGGCVVFSQRSDLWAEHNLEGILNAMCTDGILTAATWSEPQSYMPGNADFADQILVLYVTLTVA